MSEKIDIHKPVYSFLPTDIDGFDSLAELALDLHWTWDHAEDEVWRQLYSIYCQYSWSRTICTTKTIR